LLVDAHAHLDDVRLLPFIESIENPELGVLVISNSVDYNSSIKNLNLGKNSGKIIPFVGIHPEIFSHRSGKLIPTSGDLQKMTEEIEKIIPRSSGVGEIGIDPKYGSVKEQEFLFSLMLSLCENTVLPIAVHSRDSVSSILQILSTFNLKSPVLFHWFAGSDSELIQVIDRGIFVSYGPSIIVSKRLRTLVEKSEIDLILPETDSPTPFASLNHSFSSPILIASVIFKIGLIRKIQFDEAKEIFRENVTRYLGTQNSLRV
jgi:TatD DNase family protein